MLLDEVIKHRWPDFVVPWQRAEAAATSMAESKPGADLRKMLQYLTAVSFVWSILNCLPIFPMDGGQMLAAILGPQRQRTTYLIGMLTAIAIGILGYLVLHAILLTIFMAFFAYQNFLGH